MAIRRKSEDGFKIMIQLVGLGIMLSVFPYTRQLVSGLGVLLMVLAGAVIALFIVFYVIKSKVRTKPLSAAIISNCNTSSAWFDHRQKTLDKGSHIHLSDRLRRIDWFQFEKIVALTYRNQGFSVSKTGGANPDGGIDLIIRKDGITKAVQCKQWKTREIGVKTIREFLGALTDAGIKNGIFVTLNGYTEEAKRLAEKHGIEIVNETGLLAMLESTGSRFDPQMQALLEDERKFCPKCEKEMVLRTPRKGMQQFWGCSAFPRCRFTLRTNQSFSN